MIIESESMPDEPRETVAGKSTLSGQRTFLLDRGKWSKAVMAVLILGGGLLGIGQEATAEEDRTNSGGGWVNPDQRMIPRSGGWVTPSQGRITPSQGWVTPSQGRITPSQGWVTPSQGWVTPSQGWVTPSQGWVTPNQGWVNPNQNR